MQQPRRLTFDEFARQLPTVFDAVTRENRPVLIEREGLLFRVAAEHVPDAPDIWAGYSLERVRSGLRRSAGAFRGLDRARFLADVKEQRKQDSTGRPA